MKIDDRIENALKTVLDPELGLDVVTLGFVRKATVGGGDGKSVRLEMTLTSPLCPMKDGILGQVEKKLKSAGFGPVEIVLSFDPPWQPPAAVKMILGI